SAGGPGRGIPADRLAEVPAGVLYPDPGHGSDGRNQCGGRVSYHGAAETAAAGGRISDPAVCHAVCRGAGNRSLAAGGRLKIATGGRLWYNFEEPAKVAGMGNGPGPHTRRTGGLTMSESVFRGKTLLITGGTGSFGNTV